MRHGFTGRLARSAGLAVAALVFNASIPGTAIAADYALSADGNSVVRVVPQGTVSGSGFDSSLITSAYSGWTVNTASGGSVSSSGYAAGWSSGSGGATIQASYSQANAVAAGHSLNWVQVINTNVPLNGATSPYIDPVPNDDNLPFYWTTPEQATHGTNKTVGFSDFSRRDPATLATTNPITWNASLYAAEYDGNKTVTIHDGISWGWTMKPATVGSASGSFVNPSPTCPPATCSGIGTSSVSWGIGESGSLSFAGGAYSPKVGDKFKIGTLTYHNGATLVGSALDAIDLDIPLSFDNVSELNFVYHTTLGITNTPNTDDPIASADFVSFTKGGFSGSFNVLEGQTASVDLMAVLTPTLGVTPHARTQGDKDPFGVPDPEVWSFSLQLVGFENPTDGGFVTGVPEPSTGALVLVGAALLIVWRRRRA